MALRCGRECADLKAALRQEFRNLEEVLRGALSLPQSAGAVQASAGHAGTCHLRASSFLIGSEPFTF